MRIIRTASLFFVLPVFLGACASTPDPAKICTAEWIAPRAERAVDRIEKRAKKSIKALVNASDTWAQGKTPGLLQMYAVQTSLKNLEKELTDGKGIRDLKMVARTCNDPEIISDSIRDLMERQGVSDRFISQIEALPYYQRLIEDISDTEANS